MRRRLSMLLGALFCTLTLTIDILGQTAPSSPVEVAYVLTSAGIGVYDVDQQTGTPTFEGLATAPLFASVVPTTDDHFVYLYGSDTLFGRQSFYVYAADSTGMLQQPAIQEFNLPTRMGSFVIHPSGTFAYAVVSKQNSNGETTAGILLFVLDPTTGRVVGSPKLIAMYPPNGPCGSGWSISGSLGLVGFSPGGDRIYDEWFCISYDTLSYYFYTRRLNKDTGELGPDITTLGAGGGNGSYSQVNFTPSSILDYYVGGYYGSYNTLSVYPLSGGTSPIFTCTSAMLAACGSSPGDSVDPSGQYIFLYPLTGVTEITKLDLQAKLIVDTGNSIASGVRAFSPDSTLIYTLQSYTSPWTFQIYTFDLATGVATEGGQIVVQKSQFVSVVPTLRK